MKKHIFGLVIFSLIVGTAAIVYSIFNVSAIVPVSVVLQNESPGKKTACWNMKRKSNESKINSPAISQAVFDVKTKRFSWRLAESEENSSTLLHFFIQDEKGIRYIDSVPAKSLGNDGELNFSPFYMNFGKLNRQANLYLIVESGADSTFLYDGYKSRPDTDKSRQVKFDASKAVAVTVNYGE